MRKAYHTQHYIFFMYLDVASIIAYATSVN